MSEEWGVKTGTLYFHLKELGEMIDQGENKEYILTKKGQQLCQFFIREDEGKVKVEKIHAFTKIAQPLFVKLENSLAYQILIYTLILATLIGSSYIRIYLVGPIPLPVEQNFSSYIILIINIGIFLVQIGLVSGITYIFDEINPMSALRIISIAYTVNMLFITILVVLLYLPVDISSAGIITFELWFVVSVLSQVIYISVLSGSLIIGHKISITKSFILTLISMYLTSSIALIISF